MSAQLELARRQALSPRRGLAHQVEIVGELSNGRLRLVPAALCGFKPRRYWSETDAPTWEADCSRCLIKVTERRAHAELDRLERQRQRLSTIADEAAHISGTILELDDETGLAGVLAQHVSKLAHLVAELARHEAAATTE